MVGRLLDDLGRGDEDKGEPRNGRVSSRASSKSKTGCAFVEGTSEGVRASIGESTGDGRDSTGVKYSLSLCGDVPRGGNDVSRKGEAAGGACEAPASASLCAASRSCC